MIKNKIMGLILLVVSSTAFAQMGGGTNDWPVHDSVLHDNVKALHETFSHSLEGVKAQSKLDERNTYSTNLNTTLTALAIDDKNVKETVAPTLQKCIEITKAMGAGRANAVSQYNQRVLAKNITRSRDAYGNDNLNGVVQSMKTLKTCKEIDVKENVGSCTAADTLYAGMDEDIEVLSKNKLSGNASISNDQAKVALQMIKNFVYASAPTRKTGGRSANSTLYQTQLKLWHTRVSPVVNAMRHELGYNVEIKLDPGSSLDMLWKSDEYKSAYTQIYGRAIPESPSMNEIITTMVKKDMFYGNDIAKRGASNQADLLRGIDGKLALNNVMLLRMTEILTDISNQIGALTMNTYAPVSNDIDDLSQTGN